MQKFLLKYHYVLLIFILAFAFFSRIIRIDTPKTYIFDEVYHALTAKLISRNDVRAYEWWNPPVEENTAVDWLHPPYAKYTQAFFISTFGENSFGWRISSVLFGTFVILLVYKLSYELFENKNLSLLATFLSSLDGLLLTQSRIAMNDIHVTFFILLTLLMYVRYTKKRKSHLLILSGISAGIAMGTKWSGLFVLMIMVFFEGISYIKTSIEYVRRNKKPLAILQLKKIALLTFSLLILPVSFYLLSYTHMFVQGKSLFCFTQQPVQGECYFKRLQFGEKTWEGYLSHFGELHRQIWWYQTNLEATHTYQSRPYQWFLNLRPVWMHVEYQPQAIGNIYAQGNSVLFWLGGTAAIATVFLFASKNILAGFLLFRKRFLQQKNHPLKKSVHFLKWLTHFKLHPYLFFVTFSYFAVWLPWQLSPRIMFFYHYTPAVPLLSIIFAYWLIQVSGITYKNKAIGKYILTFVLLLTSLNFVVFYPNWTGIVVPKDFANHLYFAIKSWK